jgi:hypothetical protein
MGTLPSNSHQAVCQSPWTSLWAVRNRVPPNGTPPDQAKPRSLSVAPCPSECPPQSEQVNSTEEMPEGQSKESLPPIRTRQFASRPSFVSVFHNLTLLL